MTNRGEAIAAACLLLLLIAAPVTSRAASRRREPAGAAPAPALLIAADRVSGFVPFTVTVYGRVKGVEPGSIEFCRLRVPSLFERPDDRPPSRSGQDAETSTEHAEHAACVTGKAVASSGWFAYEHDLRFDQPGQYHVSLTMVDSGGRRLNSNTVRVSAF